ncbi:hypothetical protein NL676_016902 [Syzygium grande]|nr:hypothetical protein NL676_016902 [Syzygium grande]
MGCCFWDLDPSVETHYGGRASTKNQGSVQPRATEGPSNPHGLSRDRAPSPTRSCRLRPTGKAKLVHVFRECRRGPSRFSVGREDKISFAGMPKE